MAKLTGIKAAHAVAIYSGRDMRWSGWSYAEDTVQHCVCGKGRRESSVSACAGAPAGYRLPRARCGGATSFDLPTFDPLVAAKVAKLRYVSDRVPGIVRRRTGESFV